MKPYKLIEVYKRQTSWKARCNLGSLPIQHLARSTTTLIGKFEAIKTVIRMATLSIGRFLLLPFSN